jgi:CheY-like chemotaxis protein
MQKPGNKMQKKILIADDEPDTLFFLSHILKKKGFEVISCKDGVEASERLTEHPDLALLDINMPRKKGSDVCREIRNNLETSDIPIILISGNSDILEECQRCNANNFIQKPITITNLLNMVQAYT